MIYKKKGILSLLALIICCFGSFTSFGCNLLEEKIDLKNDQSLDNLEWTWSYSFPQNSHLRGIWGFSTDDIFAVGDNGTILHYNGNEWNSMTSNTSVTLFDVWGTSSNNVFAVGASGTIFHYDGTIWNNVESVNTVELTNLATEVYRYDGLKWGWVKAIELRHVWGTSINNIYIIPRAIGIVLHYDGKTWNIEQIPEQVHLSGIWGTDPDNIYTVGEGYSIFHWDGMEWQVVQYNENAYGGYSGIWGNSYNNIYVGGNSGMIKKYDGNNWQQLGVVENIDIDEIWGYSKSSVFVNWFFGLSYYNGFDWYSCEIDTDKCLSDIWGNDSEELFAVGEDGIVIHGTKD